VGTYDMASDHDRYRMIRTYFQMLVDEIALEEAAEATRAAAITASGQTAREQRHRDAVGKMKQFASWFTHGVPGGGALRKAIFEAKSGAAVLDCVEAFFSAPRNHASQTEESATEPVFADACG
jgi:tRNA-dihydrouridine synthase B